MHRTRVTGAVLLLGALACQALATTPPATAATRSFTGTASASGLDVYATNADVLPLGATVQAAAPFTSATLKALGVSQAFASAPYPGNEVAGAPGLLNGGFGIPAPSYPFIVNSDASSEPAPADRQNAGYRLHAESSNAVSEATGQLGAGEGGGGALSLFAVARVGDDDGVTTARAGSVTAGLDVPGALTLGSVRSSAQVVVGEDGKRKRTSSLVVTGVELLGIPVTLQDGALVFAGQRIPLPDNPLVAALAERGTVLEYLQPRETADGVVSAALRVTTQQTDPTGRTPGTYAVSYTLGQTSARLSAANLADVPVAAPSVPAVPTPAGVAPATVPGGPADVGGAPPAAVGGEAVAVADPPLLPVDPTGTVPAPATAAAAAPGPRAVAFRTPLQVDWLPVFLALVLSSAAALVGGSLVRLLGVRATWRS
ncbi:MAG: hypothetical protein JWM64_190 [Frankiales bacterium]|nr:hypothetical protein [Frankiales bacterium]